MARNIPACAQEYRSGERIASPFPPSVGRPQKLPFNNIKSPYQKVESAAYRRLRPVEHSKIPASTHPPGKTEPGSVLYLREGAVRTSERCRCPSRAKALQSGHRASACVAAGHRPAALTSARLCVVHMPHMNLAD